MIKKTLGVTCLALPFVLVTALMIYEGGVQLALTVWFLVFVVLVLVVVGTYLIYDKG